MNIVFLLNSPYPFYTGGRETWLYNVSQQLCKNHNVYIITEKPEPFMAEEHGSFENIDSRIQILHAPDFRNSKLLSPLLRSYMVCVNEELMVLSMRRRLKKLLDAMVGEHCYIISMDTVYTAKIGLWAKKNYANVTFINSVRGPHAEILGHGRPLLRKYFLDMEKQTLSGADQIWSNGWDTQDALKSQGFSSVVVRNGVDTSRCNRRLPLMQSWTHVPVDYQVLTIGTVQDIKGYAELIQAIASIKNKYGLIVGLVGFGKGDPQKYMDLAEKLGVAKQIVFAGVQPETVEYAQNFDLIACLSGGGGLSMACLESLLSGTPVIAWDSPVYQQMISHGETGYLVEEKNVGELAEGMYWLLTHPNESKTMGLSAQLSMADYDWSCVADSVVELLRRG